MKEKPIRIAIVGHPLSGKDVVANYLAEEYGFMHISSGDMVRKYMVDNDLGEQTRERMHWAANDMRKNNAPGLVPKMAIAEQGDHPRLVLSGTRAPSDIDPFIELGGIAIAIDAPVEDRYRRAYDRGRPGDRIPFDQFKFEEDRESESKDPYEQNVNYVMSKAEYTIKNTGSLDDLLSQVDAVMGKLGIVKTV